MGPALSYANEFTRPDLTLTNLFKLENKPTVSFLPSRSLAAQGSTVVLGTTDYKLILSLEEGSCSCYTSLDAAHASFC